MECGSYEVKTAKYTCFSPVTNKQKIKIKKNYGLIFFFYFIYLYHIFSQFLCCFLLPPNFPHKDFCLLFLKCNFPLEQYWKTYGLSGFTYWCRKDTHFLTLSFLSLSCFFLLLFIFCFTLQWFFLSNAFARSLYCTKSKVLNFFTFKKEKSNLLRNGIFFSDHRKQMQSENH